MKSNSENAGATRVKFDRLSREAQDRLLTYQRGEGDCIAIATGNITSAYVLFPLAVVWFIALYFLTNDYLWSTGKIVIFGLMTLAASYFLFHSGYRLIRWFTSASKAFLLITPHYVIDLNFNDVCYWDLDNLVSVDSERRYKAGQYVGSRVTLSFETGAKFFDMKGVDEAENTVEDIKHYRKLFIEATVRGDSAYLRANDDFYGVDRAQTRHGSGSRFGLVHVVVPIFAAALAAGAMFGGVKLNNYYDDKISWEFARSVDRASAVRYYLQTHPRGRWRADADERLQFLYDDAEKKYLASLNEGYDRKAADAVIAMMKYARSNSPCVFVRFERDNQIPPTIVEDLKKEYEVDKMVTTGDSFSNEKMSRREGVLFTEVVGAVTRVIPNDILDISTECTGEVIQFQVKYEIGADSIYFDTAQEKLPDSDKTYYPGIFILWDFGVLIPGAAEAYNFELESIPASTIRYDGDYDASAALKPGFEKILQANIGSMYDSMAASAFEDFRANLIFRMGIGDDKKLNMNIPPEEATPPKDGGGQGIPVG
jgi:hypothetical protein